MGSGHRHWVGVRKDWQPPASLIANLVSLTPELLRTHAYVLGKTGSGKTNLLHHLMAQDIILGRSFAVLDLRGDLVSAALELLAGRKDPRLVKLLDLREKERPTGFDPLYGAGEPYYRALAVHKAVEAESDSWGVQIAETFRYALLLLAESGQPLTRLESLFYEPDFLRRCLGGKVAERTANFWNRFVSLSPDRRAALASPVLNKVSALFATGSMETMLAHPNPVDLGRHLDARGSVLLVSLAVDETHSSGRMMGRIIVSSFMREIFARATVSEAKRNPVRLYVDEFENFGDDEIEAGLAEGRRFGLSLVLAHQTLAQLAPRMRSMVLGNAGCKVVFRCGRDDAAAMSRDLTGDPAAFDFARFPVGEAVVATPDGNVVHAEINAPIIRNAGSLSPRAKRFVSEIQALCGPHLPHAKAVVASPFQPAQKAVRETRPTTNPSASAPTTPAGSEPAGSLEDWLVSD